MFKINPYIPGEGVKPQYLAGRDEDIENVTNMFTALTLNILNRIFEVHKIKDYFDDIILSSECGFRKPYASIFDFLESKEDIKKEDFTILLGNDLNADIVPAKQRGYKTVFLTEDISITENESMLIGDDLETCKNMILEEISKWRDNR